MSPGSLLTPKGEDSEEDEDTEYFDAMEDATSFITVITEAKEDRWAPTSLSASTSSLQPLVLFVLGASFKVFLQC